MKKTLLPIIAAAMLTTAACSDILEEQPRSSMTPGFFSTEAGIQSGLSSVYSQLRFMYGNAGMMYLTVGGTDEATYGDNKDGYGGDLDAYNITSGNSGLSTIWDNTFPAINTCSGIIEKGVEAGVDAALIAEAKFFRAFNYFLLVQTFGGVPLDLGSGELKFNTTPSRYSARNTVEEVYTKAIFPDLEAAVDELPSTPRVVSATNKIAAQHFLAKAYLTYGWWLERNNKAGAADYYQQAYNVAVEAIKNPGTFFKLMETFRAVNLAANDRNAEILLCAEHTSSSYIYDESAVGTGGSEPNNHMKSNRSSLAMTSNFQLSVGATDSAGASKALLYRQAVQEVGKPWRLLTPTHEVFAKTFPVADRVNDTRFDGTFVTVYRANYQAAKGYDPKTGVLFGLNHIPIADGDTALYYAPTDDTKSSLAASANGAYHYYSDKAYAAWTPSLYTRHNYPSVWKFGPSRDNTQPAAEPPSQDASSRPFPIAKLSETYLIAAEAAVKGASTQAGYAAKELVNVIRKRAGAPDHSTDMENATPATIDLDYILMERSRELYAEDLRWYDLTRTGKLKEYAEKYKMCETNSAEEKETTRPIDETKHYLRPIPASQFGNMDNTDAEKALYQNPGY
jgi:hypothetical protein